MAWRVWWHGAAGAVWLLSVAAGCGTEEGPRTLPRFERSCDEGNECPGRKCVQVGLNEQGLSGVCSRACSSDADCGSDGACFFLGDAGASCLARCSDTAPCEGGLVCTVVGRAGERACFVEPISSWR